jgi:hypothetical protein
MAKLFYTLDEAAAKLKKSEAEVKAMVSSGQLQEFRDRDRLMFKVDQVDLLAGGAEGEGEGIIPLAESGDLGHISLASDSGTGMNLESPKEQTGISIFDADTTEEADPSAVTQVTESVPTDLALDTVGSGSGLLDLTREADDTSLGQDLLEEVSARDGSTASETQVEEGAEPVALFETTPGESDVAVVTPAAMMVMAEPYDGTWSGLAGGIALGMVAVLAFLVALVLFGLTNGAGKIVTMLASNFWMYVGIAAGALLIPAIVGMLIGKKS